MSTSTPPIHDGPTKSEEELKIAVWDALAQYTPVRIWDDRVQVTPHGSTIMLSGGVRSRTTNEKAEEIVRQVKGVSAVENHLVVDADVEIAIAQALAADPRTKAVFPGVLVGVVFGVVYLKGQVVSAEVKKAVSEIALKVPGVRLVSNELTALPEPAPAAKPPASKPQPAAKATA